jgi:hypothetical protein
MIVNNHDIEKNQETVMEFLGNSITVVSQMLAEIKNPNQLTIRFLPITQKDKQRLKRTCNIKCHISDQYNRDHEKGENMNVLDFLKQIFQIEKYLQGVENKAIIVKFLLHGGEYFFVINKDVIKSMQSMMQVLSLVENNMGAIMNNMAIPEDMMNMINDRQALPAAPRGKNKAARDTKAAGQKQNWWINNKKDK